MDPLTIVLTIAGLIVAAAGSWFTYLAYKKSKRSETNASPTYPPNSDSRLLALLSFFLRYPSGGGNRASWAVKESFILRGRIDDAREQPGLGVAIVTTELALDVFGNQAQPSIDSVISWALSRCAAQPPYLLIAEFFDPRTSEIARRPDFRHTLSFAIVLARTRKLDSHLREYLKLTLETQNPDGGWPPGEGTTVSEVFTVLYAVELLALCSTDERFPEDIQHRCLDSRNKGISWLVSASRPRGMWQSGVMDEFVWDDVVTTAWVLHRLVRIKDASIPDWSQCVDRAASAMTSKAVQERTWIGTADIQRFRAESRVAAAISRVLSTDVVGPNTRELMEIYLSNWRSRSSKFLRAVTDDVWDIATVAFVLESLFSAKQLCDEAEAAGLITTLS